MDRLASDSHKPVDLTVDDHTAPAAADQFSHGLDRVPPIFLNDNDDPTEPADHSAHEQTDSHMAHMNLIKTFDVIFELHQRSENIRAHLEKIDRLLLTSRTVRGLLAETTRLLREDLDLVSVRILIREDHPIISLIDYDPPMSVGTCSPDAFENGGIFPGDPYILDDPCGELAAGLFGEEACLAASAAVAVLCAENDYLGLLCLGSNDPSRYCGGMNTDLIAGLATKIALGVRNAWDHERNNMEAIHAAGDGLYGEVFFLEFLRREFDRAWRYERPFSLGALSWRFDSGDMRQRQSDTAQFLASCVRSTDIVAPGDDVMLWALLPETGLADAHIVFERLMESAARRFCGDITLNAGVTELSRSAVVPSMMIREARRALREAEQSESSTIVARAVNGDESITSEHPDDPDEREWSAGASPA